MKVLFSSSSTPSDNATWEERLYREGVPDDGCTLLFYRNAECVLCGRNQSPAAECAIGWCAANGIPVLKRISGGGTVFHDLGNLNYAFILPRRLYDPARFIGMAAEALRRIGLADVTMCSRFSLWHGPNKIGGSAFALSSQAALVHGCLPFGTNLQRLAIALQPDEPPPPGKRLLRSVTAPVENIAPLLPGKPDAQSAMANFQEALQMLAHDELDAK